jgi:peptidoglycan-associated lipoprotein
MRRVLVIALAFSALAVTTGCPKPPEKGECKSSADCAKQEGYGKVCVEGRCQECGADADCKEGFVCRTNKCVPKPQCAQDADCPSGQLCQNDRCVPRPAPQVGSACASDAECGADMSCVNGKCAMKSAGAVPPECADAGAFTIRFGFDQASLDAQSKDALQKLSDCLKRAPARRLVIAGHADERGTTQYNVALGNRRAEAARKYLSDLGLSAPAETVSYGEEKPLCTEATEACWARNRRDEFQVER